MPRKLTLTWVLTALLLAGCAGAEAVQEPAPASPSQIAGQLADIEVPEGQALVYLYRPSNFMGSANIYRLSINGVEVADMPIGTRFAQAVPPGPTAVEGRTLPNILNFGLGLLVMETPRLDFAAEEGKVNFILVSPGFAGGPQLSHAEPGEAAAKVAKLTPAGRP
jgi:hypothetical protein